MPELNVSKFQIRGYNSGIPAVWDHVGLLSLHKNFSAELHVSGPFLRHSVWSNYFTKYCGIQTPWYLEQLYNITAIFSDTVHLGTIWCVISLWLLGVSSHQRYEALVRPGLTQEWMLQQLKGGRTLHWVTHQHSVKEALQARWHLPKQNRVLTPTIRRLHIKTRSEKSKIWTRFQRTLCPDILPSVLWSCWLGNRKGILTCKSSCISLKGYLLRTPPGNPT